MGGPHFDPFDIFSIFWDCSIIFTAASLAFVFVRQDIGRKTLKFLVTKVMSEAAIKRRPSVTWAGHSQPPRQECRRGTRLDSGQKQFGSRLGLDGGGKVVEQGNKGPPCAGRGRAGGRCIRGTDLEWSLRDNLPLNQQQASTCPAISRRPPVRSWMMANT